MGRTHKEILTNASGSPAWGRGVHISTEFTFLLSGVFIMLVAWALNLLGTIAGDQGSSHGVSDVYLWLFLMFRGLGFSTVGVIGAKRHAKRHYTDGPMGGARG